MQKIEKYFEKIVDISKEEWEYFSGKLKFQKFQKNAIILEQGRIENHLFFLEEGIVRFNIPKDDYDFTFGFVFTGNFFSAYDSFLSRLPSGYNIEAVTDCSVWCISYEDLSLIYKETKVGDRIGRFASEQLYLKKQKRELSLLQDKAKIRYLKLFEEQPELIAKIPLKYIASYIGVRPQSLSRIRKDIY